METPEIQRLRKDLGDKGAMDALYTQDTGFRATVDKYRGVMKNMSPVAEAKFPSAMLNKHYLKTFSPEKPVAPRTTAMANEAAAIGKQNEETNQSLMGFAGETISNVPKSAYNYGKGIFDAAKNVFNPDLKKNTVANAGRFVLGGAITNLEMITGEDTFNNPFGSEDVADQFVSHITQRYGSLDKAANTLKTDPVGFLSDVSTLVAGVGGATKALGTGVGSANMAKAGSTIAKIGVNAEPAVMAAKTVGGAMKVGRYAVGKVTGFSDDTIKALESIPDDVTKAQKGQITRETIADKVFKATQSKMDDLSETGKGYEGLRKSGVVNTPKAGLQTKLAEYGIDMDETGKLAFSEESIPMSPADQSALQNFVSTYAKDELSTNAFLNSRKALDNLSKWEQGKTGASTAVARDLRSYFDDLGKGQVKGLKELDSKYAPLVQEAKKLQKEYIEIVTDESGKRVPILKPQALQRIASLTKKGKEAELAKMEKLIPNIRNELNALRAMEDIVYAGQHKVGAYAQGGLLAIGVGTGNIPAVIASILAAPTLAVPIIKFYGRVKRIPSQIVEGIVSKIRGGEKMTPEQSVIMSQAMEHADDTNATGLKENRMVNLKGPENTPPVMDNLDDVPLSQIDSGEAARVSNLTPEQLKNELKSKPSAN